MSLAHHPDAATLMAYAAGTLDEAFSVIVAAHMSGCAQCRKAVRDAEEMGSAIAFEASDAVCDFDALMDRIDAAPKEAAVVRHPSAPVAQATEVPVPLQRLIGLSLEDIRWRFVAPGVRKADLSAEVTGDAALFALKIAPGQAMPEHGHHGAEMTLILRGAYSDEYGRFAAGDVADHDADVEHTPVVDSQEPCICIVAADALARFKNPIARLLQPLTGI